MCIKFLIFIPPTLQIQLGHLMEAKRLVVAVGVFWFGHIVLKIATQIFHLSIFRLMRTQGRQGQYNVALVLVTSTLFL